MYPILLDASFNALHIVFAQRLMQAHCLTILGSNFLCIVFTQKEREYQQENILCVLTFHV